MYKLLITIMLIMGISQANVLEGDDPYKKIEYFVLDNGLEVYLLSDQRATNTNISMEINVGWDIENESNYGLSHLLEHMVFRDKRVPHRDYLDYFKDEGASDVNGFTSRYKTVLTTTIDSNKSYWISEIFAQMIFDKEVDSEDIETEKGAVQVEIGEKVWYDGLANGLVALKDIFPPSESIDQTHFGLNKEKELPYLYLQKTNNTKFTLEEVMQHYEKYYYPANMILKITGNFNSFKMKKLIKNVYTKVEKLVQIEHINPKEMLC